MQKRAHRHDDSGGDVADMAVQAGGVVVADAVGRPNSVAMPTGTPARLRSHRIRPGTGVL
jgi:hypothetical protein